MRQGILLSADIDFMIHGVFSYEIFGQTVWITTTHISLLLVVLALIGIAFAINRVMKKATEVPGTAQNAAEIVV
jgi:F-type H+-transporting ATPase subunit a